MSGTLRRSNWRIVKIQAIARLRRSVILGEAVCAGIGLRGDQIPWTARALTKGHDIRSELHGDL